MIYSRGYEPPTPIEFKHKQISVNCPTCKKSVGATMISAPDFQAVSDHDLQEVGAVYKCEGCKSPIFIKFVGCEQHYDTWYYLVAHQVVQPVPVINIENISHDAVVNDLGEALKCYSVGAWNAFGAMCRRTLQTICKSHDVKGKSKVEAQLKLFAAQEGMDTETTNMLNEAVRMGHDGSHPNLPPLDEARAKILLTFMEEIIRQVYDIPKTFEAAKQLREAAISAGRAQ